MLDGDDNCRIKFNPGQTDTDGNGGGDACDPDDDNDGVLDLGFPWDNCPFVANPDQVDADGDFLGNACDPDPNDGPAGDRDFDGVTNSTDACPTQSGPSNNGGCPLPAANVADLIADVNAQPTLSAQAKRMLVATLTAAQRQIDRGNELAASHILGAFIVEVRVLQKTRRLPATVADSMVADAQAIISGF